MKKINWVISFVVICLICILGAFAPSFISQVNAVAQFEYGTGQNGDPYIINNISDLEIMQQYINHGDENSAYYKLGNNISIEPTVITAEEIVRFTTDKNNGDEKNTNLYSIGNGIVEFKQVGNYYVSYLTDYGQVDCYVVVNNISSPDWYLIWNNPIGTIESPFSGYFDGNGKTINGIALFYDNYSDETSLGLFGVIQDAEIKNLSVEVSVVLIDDENTPLNSLKIGGIAGQAINSTIYNCKINFELEANQKEYLLTEDEEIDLNSIYFTRSGNVGAYTYTFVSSPIIDDIGNYYEFVENGENEYLGEIICGGAVGYGQGLKIYQCSNTTKINVVQEGTNIVNSYFGGAVGQMEGGEIYFVYVAPSDDLISSISSKVGNLATVPNSSADVILSSTKTNDSVIAFGGIVGYAQNASFVAFNNIYSSLYYTTTSTKLMCGGIIGRISSNTSYQSQNITYSQYLNISNDAYVSNFSGAIGNANSVSYIVNTTLISFNTIPTLNFYTEESWKELKEWDFTNVWKNSSIINYGNYFFPNLQCFSTYNIKLSSNHTVQFSSGKYSSGYLYLYFINENEEPIYEDGTQTKFDTDVDFEAGETIRIKAIFYNDLDDTSKNFQHYYDFTNWTLDNSAVVSAKIGNNNLNGFSTETNQTQSILTFSALPGSEGTYGINVIGEAVTINVDFKIESGTGEETGFGKINQIIGNQTINYNDNFKISINNYLSGIATVLNAVNIQNSDYIFRKWVDVNTQNIVESKEIVIELDNTKKTSTTRFYPKVIYNGEKLVVDLICYFSNNTSELTLKIIKGGNVSIDGGENITSTHNENIINNKTTTLVATPEDGYRFIGWYVSDVLISTDKSYTTSINSDKTIEARFEEISINGGGLSGWVIALIVIGSLGIIGLIIFIIFKIRKNSFNSYKKHFKY